MRLRALVLDERAKGTLRRFVADWVAPRWREIAVAFVFTAGLAAPTRGYPLIIKHSFYSLMHSHSRVLPWGLAALVLGASPRRPFFFLHPVAAAPVLTRMTTDMQKAAFAHLIGPDFARLTRETTGHLVSRLTNDLTSIQQAAQISMIAFVRDLLSVFSVLIAMFYLDWMLAVVVIGIY